MAGFYFSGKTIKHILTNCTKKLLNERSLGVHTRYITRFERWMFKRPSKHELTNNFHQTFAHVVYKGIFIFTRFQVFWFIAFLVGDKPVALVTVQPRSWQQKENHSIKQLTDKRKMVKRNMGEELHATHAYLGTIFLMLFEVANCKKGVLYSSETRIC